MKTIDKLYSMWADLDASYESFHKKLNVNSNQEFLERLLFDAKGNSLLSTYKLLLKKESADYSAEESELYSQLIMVFDALDALPKAELQDANLTSLNQFVGGLVQRSRESLAEESISEEMLDQVTAWHPSVKEMTSMTMFKLYGEVDSFTKIVNGHLVSVKLKEDFNNEFFTFGNTVLADFQKAPASCFAKTKLTKKLIQKLIQVSTELNVSGPTFTIVSKDLIKNDKLFRRKTEVLKRTDDLTVIECWGKVLYVI